MAEYSDFGKNLRAVRSRRRITQEQLGKAVGVGTTHISHMETGNSLPSMRIFLRLLEALDCSADDLLMKRT